MASRDEQLAQLIFKQGKVPIAAPRATQTKFAPTGVSGEIFEPSLEMAKKGTETTFGVMEGLSMTSKLFDEADRLIPTSDDPTGAVFTGIGRAIGSTDVGRIVGFPNEKARAYKNFRSTFGTLLARAFGEKGVVTNEDVERVMSAFPKFGDTSESRSIQKKFMIDLLQDKINRYNRLVSIIGKRGGTVRVNDRPYDEFRIEAPGDR